MAAGFHGAGGPGAPVRVLFAGSPGIAVPVLEALAAGGDCFELAGVLTNPDSPRGRSGKPEPAEAGAAAARISAERLRRGRPPLGIVKAARLDAEVRREITALGADLLVSFAYGRIFGPEFLACFPLGGINIHPSLLPKYRGATPIQAAILHRERKTGISIQRLAAEMDSGDILAQECFPLGGRETAGSLSEIVAARAVPLLLATLRGLAGGTIRGRPQNHGEATFCRPLAKGEGRIDWGQDAADIDARIRAFDPWPRCWTLHKDRALYILEALPAGDLACTGDGSNEPAADAGDATDTGSGEPCVSSEPGRVLGVDKRRGILVQTGDGALIVTRLQYQAKKALDWRAFLNGARNFAGARLV
ncbi:MAG: methionyl-tRNA formyltransferase [Treponema sp.]|jgi:methionyl-tRNA formyltransferase|nr:methionyl-tRNA formyltransferase [Treponema sp.]